MADNNNGNGKAPAADAAALAALKAAAAPNAGETPSAERLEQFNQVPAQQTESDRDVFLRLASAALSVRIGKDAAGELLAARKVFKQAADAPMPSVGYWAGDKVTLVIGGRPLKFQVSVSVTLIGSNGKDRKSS